MQLEISSVPCSSKQKIKHPTTRQEFELSSVSLSPLSVLLVFRLSFFGYSTSNDRGRGWLLESLLISTIHLWNLDIRLMERMNLVLVSELLVRLFLVRDIIQC